ncbi:MAG: hypothetical protein ACLQVD_22345 [Capsulimonadaceae bacterium]
MPPAGGVDDTLAAAPPAPEEPADDPDSIRKVLDVVPGLTAGDDAGDRDEQAHVSASGQIRPESVSISAAQVRRAHRGKQVNGNPKTRGASMTGLGDSPNCDAHHSAAISKNPIALFPSFPR